MSVARQAPGPLLVVAESLPTQASGTRVLLRRLLDNFRPEEIVLLARRPAGRRAGDDPAPRYAFHPIPAPPPDCHGDRYWRIASSVPAVLAGVGLVRRYRPSAILAVFPYEHALLTGYGLHLATGLPLLAYFCDLYLEDHRSGWETRLAAWLQPRVFRRASRILALSEGMADYYRQRYGLEARVLPACINAPIPVAGPPKAPGRPFLLGYSGNVNSTRLDALRDLVQAVEGEPEYAIRYFTPQSPDELRAQGLWSARTSAEFIPNERDLIRGLEGCDVLFLPVSFEAKDNSRDQLATCFGTKSSEYFLSSRPVVVQCPADYYITRFFRDRDCGLVVNERGPAALARALRLLRQDDALRARLVRNALRAAQEFAGPTVASLLRKEWKEARGAGEGSE